MKSKEFFKTVLVFDTDARMLRKVGREEAAKLVNSGQYYKVCASSIAEIRKEKKGDADGRNGRRVNKN
ncbi:MAG: hypothetical protein U9N01_04345 [Euryarchaeota archaeon]|nr:hypothetical protein [Euryarchaeota archaeon]